ncbi:MAG: DNA translocase FtsK [Thermaerobacter sp.]|nr:DNA translocase FtsK [Thermaerobacter sp.]
MTKTRRKARRPSSNWQREIWGLVLAAAALFALIWYWRPAGLVGGVVARGADALLGSSAVPWLIYLLALGILMVRGSQVRAGLRWGSAVLLLWWTGSAYALSLTAKHSDWLGALAVHALDGLFGSTGRDLFLVVWPIVTLSLMFRPFLGNLMRGGERAASTGMRKAYRKVSDFVFEEIPAQAPPSKSPVPTPAPVAASVIQPLLEPFAAAAPEAAELQDPILPAPLSTGAATAIPSERALRPRVGNYRMPPLSLLQGPDKKVPQHHGAQARAQLLEETLKSFGVQARVLEYQQGPAVTRFEVQPGPGVKVSRVVALADDIALAMAATDVRMEAPIPGKAAIGIEIPNGEIAPVRLREVLETTPFRDSASLLTVGLGKDIAGRPVVAALDRMPHLLIAGATGSGKSVCLNALIASLLFRATPDEVRLLLIDPKVVELQQFNGIPHLLAPVVTDPKKAAGVLRGVLREMEDRYLRFARAGCRDIQRYNELAEEHGEERMSYYVVVIDELADLMMVAPNEVEETICRLAQMARAAGIHLVVATQRPSVDVITGLIKANIPSRIAFAVSSQVDSRTILDQGGAERLLGKGDMLFAPLGAGKPIRTQGAFISEKEMERLLEFVRQEEPDYRDDLVQPVESQEEEQDLDELFTKAVEVVVQAHSASASLLQSRMRVGYSRARRLIEQMEQKGIVGPPDGSKPREVRLSQMDYERLFPPAQG